MSHHTIPKPSALPDDYFAGGSNVPTGNLAAFLKQSTGRIVLGPFRVALDSTDVHRLVYRGPSAEIVSFDTAIDGALTVGDATITASISGVGVTDGVITITQSSSAAGDVDTATPTALKTLAAGAVLELTAGGTNTAPQFADVSVLLVT